MTVAVTLGWSLTPLPILAAVAALVLFLRGFTRLRRRRPDLARLYRAVLFSAAVVLATAAVVSPLHELGERYLLSAHMLQHVVVGDLAPALAVVALRGPLLVFVVPATLLAALARRPRLRSSLGWVVHPAGAFALWGSSLALWHVPAVYDYAAAHEPVHVLQHTSFALFGTLAWVMLVDPARRGVPGTSGKLAFALGMFVTGQLLGTTLILAEHPLFPAYALQPERLLGLSPLGDQDAAGLVMMVEQLLVLGTFAFWAIRTHLDEGERGAASLALAEERHPLAT